MKLIRGVFYIQARAIFHTELRAYTGIIGIPIKILLLPASSFRDRELL
jgi:hypothetical protein